MRDLYLGNVCHIDDVMRGFSVDLNCAKSQLSRVKQWKFCVFLFCKIENVFDMP